MEHKLAMIGVLTIYACVLWTVAQMFAVAILGHPIYWP